MPWIFLSVAVILWGLAPVKAFLNQGALAPSWKVPMLHRMVFRDYPVVTTPVDPARIGDPAYRNERAEPAQFTVNWASATGTAILLAAIASALYLRVSVAQFFAVAGTTLRQMRAPLATIMLMLSLGFVTRYGGTDATLGLAFTKTGWLYPFFGTLLGWLGVALTGSDTSSNVLFGSLQKITAQQLGLQSHPDRHRQQHRRRHGQDDRRPEHCRRHGVHRTGRPGGAHPALRVLAQRGAGRHHGGDRHAAGLRVPMDDPGVGVLGFGA